MSNIRNNVRFTVNVYDPCIRTEISLPPPYVANQVGSLTLKVNAEGKKSPCSRSGKAEDGTEVSQSKMWLE